MSRPPSADHSNNASKVAAAPAVLESNLANDPRLRLLTLAHPRSGNALSPALVASFTAAFDRALADPIVRTIILTGTGKYFCTGMKLDPSASLPTGNGHGAPPSIFNLVRQSTKPTVALVNGPALGGGAGLALACDVLIFASPEKCWLAFPEVRRGLAPALISLVVVPALGAGLARRVLLTAERVYPAQLPHAIVVEEGGDPLANAASVAQDLCLAGPEAIVRTKRVVDAVSRAVDRDADIKQQVGEVFTEMMASDEAAEGIAAFMQKRAPAWAAETRAKL
ncbi:ClpP/crotonase-like domain-containing protein [Catenaria anguillulae PL171]|uniref:ClpP/crotonase-like domain-containing protein n=1 Tax=Catenaria anguillulae PL171 TaxID=765915 RepID=A0A1Y2H6R7_9FUNG|nr:ClpP/crotonase-like domain-containing protein [Catenaria anguillulae PL171]